MPPLSCQMAGWDLATFLLHKDWSLWRRHFHVIFCSEPFGILFTLNFFGHHSHKPLLWNIVNTYFLRPSITVAHKPSGHRIQFFSRISAKETADDDVFFCCQTCQPLYSFISRNFRKSSSFTNVMPNCLIWQILPILPILPSHYFTYFLPSKILTFSRASP